MLGVFTLAANEVLGGIILGGILVFYLWTKYQENTSIQDYKVQREEEQIKRKKEELEFARNTQKAKEHLQKNFLNFPKDEKYNEVRSLISQLSDEMIIPIYWNSGMRKAEGMWNQFFNVYSDMGYDRNGNIVVEKLWAELSHEIYDDDGVPYSSNEIRRWSLIFTKKNMEQIRIHCDMVKAERTIVHAEPIIHSGKDLIEEKPTEGLRAFIKELAEKAVPKQNSFSKSASEAPSPRRQQNTASKASFHQKPSQAKSIPSDKIITCGECRTKNRVSAEKLKKVKIFKPICSVCRAELLIEL